MVPVWRQVTGVRNNICPPTHDCEGRCVPAKSQLRGRSRRTGSLASGERVPCIATSSGFHKRTISVLLDDGAQTPKLEKLEVMSFSGSAAPRAEWRDDRAERTQATVSSSWVPANDGYKMAIKWLQNG